MMQFLSRFSLKNSVFRKKWRLPIFDTINRLGTHNHIRFSSFVCMPLTAGYLQWNIAQCRLDMVHWSIASPRLRDHYRPSNHILQKPPITYALTFHLGILTVPKRGYVGHQESEKNLPPVAPHAPELETT